MSITASLLSFGLRHVLDVSADQLITTIEKRLTDHSQALPKALARANDRAWVAVGLALAGDSWFDRIKDVFRDGDMKGVRDQIKTFLAQTTTGLESTNSVVRAKATEEWLRLRKSKKLVVETIHPADLARRAASIERHGDPAGMTAAAHRAVADTANALRVEFPHLAELLIAVPAGGSPLLVSAFAFFFRRELETNSELAHGLSFDFLYQISAQQEQGFALLDARTEGILGQIDVLFDAIDAAIAGVHAQLSDINGKLDDLIRRRDVVTRTTDPLKVSVTDPREANLLRRWLAELRSLPPELLDAAIWTKLGDALAAGRILADARLAQESATVAAKAAADRAAEAEAAYKTYRVACEQEDWSDALSGLVRAAELDPNRFAPFPLNRYEPVRVLGAGGFGTVVLCRERLKKNREVAVKTLHTLDLGRDLDELFGEAHTVSELDDPGIIRVIHWDFADTAESRPFLVMEYFAGVSLAVHLKKHSRLTIPDFIAVARNVAEAMEAAHTAGVIHRDLKPGNILVLQTKGRWDVRVIDFGLAVRFAAVQASVSTSLPQRTRRDQSFAGTLEYASPEQKGLILAQVGPRSDVYSFGKTMLEALLGTTDPVSDDWEIVPEEYRDSLKKVLERCVIRDPAKRHTGFESIVSALKALDPSDRVNRERLERETAERAQAEATRAAEERARKNAEQAERLKREQEEAERKRQVAEAEEKRQQEEARRKAEDEAKAKDPFHPGKVRNAGDTVKLKLPGDVPITFAWCPPGTFRMGSEHPEAMKDDWCKKTERPVHNVTLTKGFFMGIHPVTQAQWKAVMGTEPSHFKGPNRPVEQVSWDDCQEFCQKLTGLLKGKATVHLPTEAEWEYACRAGTTTEFWFGDVINPDLANYDGNHQWNGSPKGKYREQTTDVGTVGNKNAWGLFDVHGNVFEWCEDAWEEAFYAKSPDRDPVCNNNQTTARVLRGGSWSNFPYSCRSAYRSGYVRGYRCNDVGFRVCFRLDG